ncbi:vomeronasal type-2 receptor 26-like [Lithobates pipiens]
MVSSHPIIILFCLILQCMTTRRSKTHNPACTLKFTDTFDEFQYFRDGDVIIGGVLSVKSKLDYFSKPKEILYKLMPGAYIYALIFTSVMEDINQTLYTPINVSLGYHLYDSWFDPRKAIRSVLNILSGPGKTIPNYSCRKGGKLAGVIGDQYSTTTIPIAQILGLYRYTQISYGSTDYTLTDRRLYPHVFKTIQNDHVHYLAIAKLVKHFGWTWVGIFLSDNDTGENEARILKRYLSAQGICVALETRIIVNYSKLVEWKNKIRDVHCNIVIVCGSFINHIYIYLKFYYEINPNTVIILPPTWAYTDLHLHSLFPHFNAGLKLGITKIIFPRVRAVLDNSLLLRPALSKLLNYELSITLYNVSTNQNGNNVYLQNATLIGNKVSLPDVISCVKEFLFQGSSVRMFLAVQALATATFLQCRFNAKFNISRFDQKPESQCSINCQPGTRKMQGKSIHPCCYDCVPCSEGEISNTTDSENCIKCTEEEWPNEKKDRCIPKLLEFLPYADDISIIFIFISVLLSIVTFLVIGIFISYLNTPIVKANNRNLSFVLLVSILLSFLCVFLFLGQPLDITCILRVITFGVLFSIAVSSLLAKTIMVYIAFKATKPGSYWRKWIGVTLANSIVLVCSSIQVIICLIWMSVSHPYKEMDTHSYQDKIVIQCNEGSVIGFYSVLGYMGFLAAVSFVVAFMMRTLPDSFNEAKYITFSMLVFCSVWIAMIPAYLSTKGKFMVAVEIFAILASSAGLLGCIFLPKCFIIIFKPKLNTRACLFGIKYRN